MAKKPKKKAPKSIGAITHDEAKRRNIPTAEHQPLAQKDLDDAGVTYERDGKALKEEKEVRDRDQDPQLVWRGKDQQDWSDLVVNAPPIYIQEKVHPKVLIDDLRNRINKDEQEEEPQANLFADFNGLPDEGAKTEFYQHDANWSNRMILGDSLQVMASLAEREGLRGKVQCIYFDPPYGIKFNSNFQWAVNNSNEKNAKVEQITREPEQVKAFRDTWRDGIHSYLFYLRDRLTVCRDLLAESGSIFVQIGDENVHRVRSLMDEVFGSSNFISQIAHVTTGGVKQNFLATQTDYILWYGKDRNFTKFRQPLYKKDAFDGSVKTFKWIELDTGIRRGMTAEERRSGSLPKNSRIYRPGNITTQDNPEFSFVYRGKTYNRPWKTTALGLERAGKANRLHVAKNSLSQVNYLDDYPVAPVSALWTDTFLGSFAEKKIYVVQTSQKVIQRCILMASDPGDLVLDPTCGSGTTANVCEQWGRRWITIDTSRVAMAIARARVMGGRYPFYLLADSADGRRKEEELGGTKASSNLCTNNIIHGFVYERVPHITLKSIAHNAEIDEIWDKFQKKLVPILLHFNEILEQNFEEWSFPAMSEKEWAEKTKSFHYRYMKLRTERQVEIDRAISEKADFEYLYDKPYEDSATVRVAGPFTVESLSPHRSLGVDENDELIDGVMDASGGYDKTMDFIQMVLANLKRAGVQQAHKEDKVIFSSLAPWPGQMICAEGKYSESEADEAALKRAAIFIGPEFGTVSRPDLVAAAREAADVGFDVLVTCAFNYDAHSTEFAKLGSLPVLKARMNADLHMAEDLKNTGKGNLFVIFGEPDISFLETNDDKIQVKINGVDVFHPNSGKVISDNADGIACWFVDTDYNEESFFVRQAYFLGKSDPYKSLKTTLKAEINEEAWATLNSNTSRPFAKPSTGRIAVKVINHLGDEVMKVYKVD